VFRTLVSVEELEKHLGDPQWVVVDCRHLLQDHGAGRRIYEAAHVPGAHFADMETELAGPKTGKNGRHPLPDPEKFAAFLRELGVNDGTQIVAYDAGADMGAARLWFLSRWIGHDAVAVLDGGFAAWAGMGKRVAAEIPARPNDGTIQPHVRRDLVTHANDVLRSLESKEFWLVDARGPDRFMGQNEVLDPVGGHIPGAVNRPFRSNFAGPFGQMKPRDQLRSEFEAMAIAPAQMVHQCGSGVSAAVNMLAMEHAGIEGSRLYAGSWSEWCSDPSRPMVTATV